MKFIVLLEIFCFIVNFQFLKSQTTYQSNGTIYVEHGNETVTTELPKHGNNSELDHHKEEPKKDDDPKHETGEHRQHKQREPKKNDDSEHEDGEHNQHNEGEPEINDDPAHEDHFTFITLIEIMFKGGSRKNCTGAIIHDNVVITAAHCFQMENRESLKLELAGSFVIIGTQRMFDAGYEQYLPIERVLIHPDYKVWDADLALVYTFAGMMSDKPGNIIPLAEGNAFTSLYTSVTVLNWNQINRNNSARQKTNLDSVCSKSSEEMDTYFHKVMTNPALRYIFDRSKKGTEENRLYTEDYMIFDTHKCKLMVEKLKPAIYKIENVNSTLCYSKRNPTKVQADSGAPAVHRNYLVAIATGDFNTKEDHVIVATKLNCYCTWISENLPPGGDQLQCCTDCCHALYFKSYQDDDYHYQWKN